MEKRQIKVSEVLALLEKGKDRAAIKQELGLTHADMSTLFKNPKLKNKKPKVQSSFELVDDTEETTEATAEETTASVDTPVAEAITQTEETSTVSEAAPEPAAEATKVQEGVW